MNKRNKNRVIGLIIAVVVGAILFVPRAPKISNDEAKMLLSNRLTEVGFKDEEAMLKEVEFSNARLTTEEKAATSGKGTDAGADKKIAEVSIDTFSFSAEGAMEVIYQHNGDYWTIFKISMLEEESWTYTPKKLISQKEMLEDISQIQVQGFEKGYIGDPSRTSMRIESRTGKDGEIKDKVKVIVSVKTTFANYKIPLELNYNFVRGEWILESSEVGEKTDWEIDFMAAKKPQGKSKSQVLEALTNENNFLTYAINKGNADELKVVKQEEIAGQKTITYQDIVEVYYRGFGRVQYALNTEHEWLGGNWAEKETSTSIVNVNIEEVKGIYSDEVNKISINSLKRDRYTPFEKDDMIVFDIETEGGKLSGEARLKPVVNANKFEFVIEEVKGNDELTGKPIVWNLGKKEMSFSGAFLKPIKTEEKKEEPKEEEKETGDEASVLDYLSL